MTSHESADEEEKEATEEDPQAVEGGIASRLRRRRSRGFDVLQLVVHESKQEKQARSTPIESLARWHMSLSQPLRCRKLVVLLAGVERIPARVLADLLRALRRHSMLSALPFVLLFGLATHLDAFQSKLPPDALSGLWPEHFVLRPPVEALNALINELIIPGTLPIHLCGDTLRLLIQYFVVDDFCVGSLRRALHTALLLHFESQPLSFLCDVDQREEGVTLLSLRDLAAARRLPSVFQYMLSRPSESVRLASSAKLQEQVLRWARDIDHHRRDLCWALDLFHTMATRFSPQKMTRQQCFLHLTQGASGLSAYTDILSALKGMSLRDLRLELQSCAEQLEECLDHTAHHPTDKAGAKRSGERKKGTLQPSKSQRAIEERGREIERGKAEERENQVLENDEERQRRERKAEADAVRAIIATVVAPKPKVAPSPARRVSNSKTRRSVLLAVSRQAQAAADPIRAAAVQWFENFCARRLCCLSKFPLHEPLLCRQAIPLSQLVQAAPRATLHRALTDSDSVLGNLDIHEVRGRARRRDELRSELPDVCIAFQLYEEAGRTLRTSHWLQAFSAVHADVSPQELEARFVRATSTLRTLGFIKTNPKKPDTITKLSFATH